MLVGCTHSAQPRPIRSRIRSRSRLPPARRSSSSAGRATRRGRALLLPPALPNSSALSRRPLPLTHAPAPPLAGRQDVYLLRFPSNAAQKAGMARLSVFLEDAQLRGAPAQPGANGVKTNPLITPRTPWPPRQARWSRPSPPGASAAPRPTAATTRAPRTSPLSSAPQGATPHITLPPLPR